MSTKTKVHMVLLPIVALLVGLIIYDPSVGALVFIMTAAAVCLSVLYFLLVEAISESIDKSIDKRN